MASAFVHLHTHSSYSPMQGVPTLEALCQAVKSTRPGHARPHRYERPIWSDSLSRRGTREQA